MSGSFEKCRQKFKKDSNYHLGNLFLDCMSERDPEGIFTIDGATGEEETNASVLARCIALAKCFRRLGLKPGDVLVLGGTLHLHIHTPYYAAIMEGLPVVGVDPLFKYDEIRALFETTKPKIAFCQYETYDIYSRAAKDLGIDLKIVTFDEGECTFIKFMDVYSNKESTDNYEPATFDKEKIYAWLVSTSGTTGLPKLAAFKHDVVIKNIFNLCKLQPPPSEKSKIACHISPVQWISSYFNVTYYPLMNNVKLQTSRSSDIEHLIDIINKYQPYTILASPATLSRILGSEKHCDLTCFDFIVIGGEKSSKELILTIQSRLKPRARAVVGYGQTEMGGPVLTPLPSSPIESCGVPLPHTTLQLVNPETGVVITEPNVTGELWYKGLRFTEYYNNPTETAKAFTEDGWYKSGDLMYRDENNNYFFVERLKLLIKYKNYHISPPELENLIGTLEGVQEVCVVGIPHAEDGQLPVACVVRRPGCDVTADEIKQLVADKLSIHKQLRGGVMFLDKIPLTSTGKQHRSLLQKMALTANRE